MSVSILCILSAVFGQQAAGPAATAKPPAEATNAIEDFKADAKEYVMRLDARPDVIFTLREEPLLHWGNPARTGEDGAVFVWMLDGRPQVIGSVFTYRLPKA
ncbi:MAG TPA: hypothetical protein VGX78_08535, partial [Pirellulales bacterium]|nr:hypothetical protein [Pirellulales bacterium]